ncbi:MAG: ornithine carbamoyltransferase [Rhizobiales bacterium]|nr:ornithine carbamoyltransferase [Hyphomicrobiales bacterium]
MADSGLRHFLDLSEFDASILRGIVDDAAAYKRARGNGAHKNTTPLAGRTLAMIFEQPSTRTRISFDVAMRQLGGESIFLSHTDMQIGRGEAISDTAKVLSRYVDAIVVRGQHEIMMELAEHATVPVINGLTERSHPCQLMADVMTFEEHCGPIKGRRIAWSGDGNNVANSWIHAAARFGFEFRLACPEPLDPPASLIEWAREQGANVSIIRDPAEAVAGVDCVVTDTWVSMSDDDAERRHNLLRPYQVDTALMSHADPAAIFMHCLPAHRGEEVTDEVMDGAQSVVFDEAENRLHAQKGILAWCIQAGR